MAQQPSQLAVLPNARLGSLIAPREHGAWGLLFVPLATGGSIGLLAGGNGLATRGIYHRGVRAFLAQNANGELAGNGPCARSKPARASRCRDCNSPSRGNGRLRHWHGFSRRDESRDLLLVGSNRDLRFYGPGSSPETGPAHTNVVPDRRHARTYCDSAGCLLRGDRKTGPGRLGFVGGELSICRQPDSFCATPDSLHAG